MTLDDLRRVCDDAERHNSQYAGSDDSGWNAIIQVRREILKLSPYKADVEIKPVQF